MKEYKHITFAISKRFYNESLKRCNRRSYLVNLQRQNFGFCHVSETLLIHLRNANNDGNLLMLIVKLA